MLLTDSDIMDEVLAKNMIQPFVEDMVEEGISYGLGSFGYDLRLGSDFYIFDGDQGDVVDPKSFNENIGDKIESNAPVLLSPNSFMLGHAVEKLTMPDNVVGICVGKSTYARSGLVVNITPVEPGWKGYLTIEMSNTTNSPIKVYPQEGIAQILFFKGDYPRKSYEDREGKYQNQEKTFYFSKI
uniref:Deoxycytidine triphosphate deaminase n=1 Tax=uncultured organism TaxID=155900 RepID=M1QAU4_9ZZZZ|nr:deoxycytidine triphosphate deaminase [uncultured organism]